MSEMKELYERVASDPSLQKRFIEIMEGAQPSEKEATGQKLIDFAREAGFDVTLDEIRDFSTGMEEKPLTDAELDMVAGGKGGGPSFFEQFYHKTEHQIGKWEEDPWQMFKYTFL